jgi:hypothetical protein
VGTDLSTSPFFFLTMNIPPLLPSAQDAGEPSSLPSWGGAKGEPLGETLGPPPAYVGAFPETELHLCLPASFDVGQLCATTPEGGDWPPQHRVKLAYVVHSVIQGAERSHHRENSARSGTAPINAAFLRTLLGKGKKDFATLALRTLMRWGALERRKEYSRGRHARLYSLGHAHRNAPLVWQSVNAPRLAKKLAQREAAESARHASAAPAGPFIWRNLDAVSVAPAALPLANDRCALNAAERAAWTYSAGSLAAGVRRWIRYSPNTGRAYHAVTNCPSALRPFLLIDGAPCAEVDIASAQFFLLLGLYPAGSAERERFAAAVTSGDFYGWLWRETQQRTGGDPRPFASTAEREAFKIHAIRKVLYERLYPRGKVADVWAAFAGAFPELGGLIAERRRTAAAVSAFNCEMQKREAALVLGNVFGRITSAFPQSHAVSIHDAALCPTDYAEPLAQLMREEAEKLYGVAPFVRIKRHLIEESRERPARKAAA